MLVADEVAKLRQLLADRVPEPSPSTEPSSTPSDGPDREAQTAQNTAAMLTELEASNGALETLAQDVAGTRSLVLFSGGLSIFCLAMIATRHRKG